MAFAIFIPVAYLHFVYALVEVLDKRKKFLIFSYFLFSLFLVADITPYFISHVEPILNFQFWPIAGPFYSLFLIIWFFYVIYSTYLLYEKYRISRGIIRSQIKYVILGMVIGFTGGSTNYFLWYRIPILPIGNILVSVFVAAITYAILKYRLMDIRIVTRNIFIYFISSGFTYGSFFFLVWLFEKYFGGVFTFTTYLSGLIIAPVFVLSLFWFYGIIRKFANRYLFFSLYSYQETINNLSQQLNYLNDLDEIIDLIVDTVKQSMQLDRAGVLLFSHEDGVIRYKIAKTIGFDKHNGISLVQDSFLTRHLEKTQKSLVREELALLARETENEQDKKRFLEIESNMKRIEASLCLPLMSSKKLIGIIVLGSKISGDAYTKEDLELLNTLSYQAGIAVDNARLYQEIQNFNKTLQQKVDEQTKEIKEAYEVEKQAHEELKKLDENKTEFMMITQHHLRTPLTSMMGYMDLIKGGSYGKVPKKLEEVMQKFSNSSQNLIKIVNEFLDLSQFQLGKQVVSLQDNVDVKVILENILKELSFQAEKRGISLNLEKAKENIPPIKADPSKLQMALFNVIDNSIKYTPKGGITIQVKNKTIDNGRKIEIIVKDTGIGMTKEDIDSLFSNLLARGEGAKKVNVTGRGIGLYLSAKIIEAHNGRIWAESEGEGKGSAFHIELPVGS